MYSVRKTPIREQILIQSDVMDTRSARIERAPDFYLLVRLQGVVNADSFAFRARPTLLNRPLFLIEDISVLFIHKIDKNLKQNSLLK